MTGSDTLSAQEGAPESAETPADVRLVEEAAALELAGVTKRYGDVLAVEDFNLRIAPGEFFALLGPSGCGKSTTLRAMAGFEALDAGRIYLGGVDVTSDPPFRRDVNLVFQDYALFPHLNLRDNVAFSLKIKRVARGARRSRADEMLERVALPGLGDRSIKEISGGQQQRVALARALINRPKVLLLDEPLGALDLKLRRAMQLELKSIQRDAGISFVYVTHDQEEALAMADRIAVMNAGHALQIGTPREIYDRPTSRFVANFIGESSFLNGTAQSTESGLTSFLLGSGEKVLALSEGPLPARTVAMIRPEHLELLPLGTAPSRSEGPINSIEATVTALEYGGRDVQYFLISASGDRLTSRMPATVPAFEPGSRVTASFSAQKTILLDAHMDGVTPEEEEASLLISHEPTAGGRST